MLYNVVRSYQNIFQHIKSFDLFEANLAVYLFTSSCFQVSFFLFIVFVVYTMLPFSMRGAIIASAITCLSHTFTLSVCLASKVTELEPFIWQVKQIIAHVDSQTFEHTAQHRIVEM